MPRGINLVVTCTKKKQRPARESLQLRSIDPALPATVKVRKWIQHLKAASGETISPATLYAGDHWSVVKEIASKDSFKQKHVRVWVCSAGYGLIPMDCRIHPYSATFSGGHPDSVALGNRAEVASAHAAWWEKLTEWDGPESGAPRSIAALAENFPDDLLLVSVSETYLQAVSPDILTTIEQPAFQADRLAILCSGVRDFEGLSPFLLPCDARFQQLVGGALSSLNIRLARHLINNTTPSQWSRTKLRTILGGWLEEQPDRIRYDRIAMTDAEVVDEIKRALQANPASRPTPLLRVLRDSGRACEHSRFVRLFHETASIDHGKR